MKTYSFHKTARRPKPAPLVTHANADDHARLFAWQVQQSLARRKEKLND